MTAKLNKRAGRATRPDLLPIANWGDAKAYPLPTVSRARLAWEFLRRNPVYRRAWLAWHALPESERLSARYEEPDDPEGHSRPLHAAILERFGLAWPAPPQLPPDPNIGDAVPYFAGDLVSAIQSFPGVPGESWTVTPRPGEVWIRFDVRRPLGPQWDKARRLVMSKRAFDRRVPDPETLIRWLRLLDADDAGVALAQVARWFDLEGVSQTPQGARQALRQAERLRQGDYLVLL